MSVKYLLKDIKLPKEIELVKVSEDENMGVFEVEPFERGMGTTVGNILRRTLLSSIQGFSVVAVRINTGKKFLSSEYEAISGLIDDSIDVIERLKNIKFVMPQDQEGNLLRIVRAEFNGKGICKADIFETSDVSILNGDMVLFEAVEDVEIVIELEIELGRGYVPSEITETRIEEVGTVSVDAVFSPVEEVFYNIENVRIGHRSDYEKLVLTVVTHGTIRAVDAVAQAAKLIKENLTVFINFNEETVETITEGSAKLVELQKLLDLSIDELELSSRSYNCLRNANILNIGALVRLTEREIQNLPNFGSKSMDEIQAKLADFEFTLGMQLPAELENNGG